MAEEQRVEGEGHQHQRLLPPPKLPLLNQHQLPDHIDNSLGLTNGHLCLMMKLDMWWKVYFWLYLALSVIGAFGLLEFTPLKPADFLGLLLSIILLIAAFAYVHKQKKSLKMKQWRWLFWIVAFFFLEKIAEIYFLPKDIVSTYLSFLQTATPLTDTQRLFSWLISAPAFYGLYKLSFKK